MGRSTDVGRPIKLQLYLTLLVDQVRHKTLSHTVFKTPVIVRLPTCRGTRQSRWGEVQDTKTDVSPPTRLRDCHAELVLSKILPVPRFFAFGSRMTKERTPRRMRSEGLVMMGWIFLSFPYLWIRAPFPICPDPVFNGVNFSRYSLIVALGLVPGYGWCAGPSLE